MTTEAQPASTSNVDKDPIPVPACDNRAIATCYKAWVNAYTANRGLGASRTDAADAACEAYRAAMPPLTGERNIRDYIACTVQGIAINAIPAEMGSRLLYGAQVAHGARRRKESKKKASENTAQTRNSGVNRRFSAPPDRPQATNHE